MRRCGDVQLADLGEPQGREAGSARPVVIVTAQLVLDPEHPQPRSWVLSLRWIVGVGTALVGATAAALLTWVGHCSAFGGRCPADPEPLWENDVFGTVWMIVAVTVALGTFCLRPDRRGAVGVRTSALVSSHVVYGAGLLGNG